MLFPGKTKLVAWFVSNCAAKNARLEYARSLSEEISVDIFGSCGELRCSKREGEQCRDKLREQYKFYLAFENSDCKDYVTEKFFTNSLHQGVVPIVMGPTRQQLERVAPGRENTN